MPPVSAPQASKRIRLIRRLTRALNIPMALLSLVFLSLVVADLAAPPDAWYRPWLDEASLAIWALFVLEFLLKLAIAPNRLLFLKRSWFDILVLAVPMLRVLRAISMFRALRAARALRAVSLFRLGSAIRRGSRALTRFTQISRLGYVSAVTMIVVSASAAAILLMERDAAHTQIRTFGDALWWSAALVTTVASDLQPVTTGGRMLAVTLMIYGMCVFGYLVSQAVAFIQLNEAEKRQAPPPG